MLDWLAKDHANVDLSLSITSAHIVVMRAPCETPVKTSFGTMIDRPAVYLQLETSDGVRVWEKYGVIFPPVGQNIAQNCCKNQFYQRLCAKLSKTQQSVLIR